MTLNKVMLIGNLTRDPETRSTPQGQTVTTFSVATSRQWTDAAGTRKEKTEFHNIVAWAKLAEICQQFLAKGRKIFIEGRLQTRDWTGDDGTKRYRTEIVAENMIMLDRAPGAPSSAPATPTGVAAAAPAPTEPNAAPAEEEIKVEDIPF